MIRRFFASVREWVEFLNAMGNLIAIPLLFLFLLHSLQPIAPLITFVVCLALTCGALDSNKLEQTLIIGGVVLYASGWAVAPFIGPIGGSVLCVIGFVIWAQGVMWALVPSAAPRWLSPA